MKRVLSFLLALIMFFSMAACGAKEEPQKVDAAEESSNDDTQKDSNTGAVEVEENLFSVEITVPAGFFEGETTQEALDKQKDEHGWKSATLNADGSVTYVMTKAQHAEVMDEMKKSIEDSLAGMIGSDDYPNIVSIKANDNYTEFEIVTKNEAIDFNELFSVYAYYIYGAMYNSFNGTPVDNINVKFINEASGSLIEEYNSKDMDTPGNTDNIQIAGENIAETKGESTPKQAA